MKLQQNDIRKGCSSCGRMLQKRRVKKNDAEGRDQNSRADVYDKDRVCETSWRLPRHGVFDGTRSEDFWSLRGSDPRIQTDGQNPGPGLAYGLRTRIKLFVFRKGFDISGLCVKTLDCRIFRHVYHSMEERYGIASI